jgi:hypothetical protein
VEQGLFPGKVGTPEYRAVLAIEDPYNYLGRKRLSMPKFMIDASGDQFFLPDGSQFYWPKIQEEKHIRYVPECAAQPGGLGLGGQPDRLLRRSGHRPAATGFYVDQGAGRDTGR